jgi:polar amino acid transport system permease protein
MTLDFAWLADPYYLKSLASGLVITLQICALSIVLVLLIGLAGAYVVHTRVPFAARIATILVELFRNTPPLVQLFILYFTLPELGLSYSNPLTGHQMPLFSGFFCVVLSLALYNGAMAVEVFRSGLNAVPGTMIEAARSLGYRSRQIFISIEMPLAMRLSFAGTTNNIVSVIKTSSQASLVAVGDILYHANQVSLETFRNLEVMILILIVYLVIVSVTVFAASLVEARFRMPGYGK